MNMKKKLMACALALAISFGTAYEVDAATHAELAQITVNKSGSNFKYWNKDAASYQALTAYVKNVTDKNSASFIPVEDRVAVFDMDGTFLCETAPYYFDHMLFIKRALKDKDYTASASDKEFAEALEKWLVDKTSNENLGGSAPHQASVFAGMTYADFEAYTKAFMKTPVSGLSNLLWGDAFYLPMVEVIKYLQANDFKVYVVSGTDREICRALVCDLFKIPPENVIGTDIKTLASHQGDKDGLDYTYRKDDELVRGEFVIKDIKMNKVSAIAREIGRQPVLAFGNSSGDAAMLNYALTNNKYKSASFFLLCDDLQRELGNTKKADSCLKLAKENGWVPVSMKDDFKTIYGDNVKRTAP